MDLKDDFSPGISMALWIKRCLCECQEEGIMHVNYFLSLEEAEKEAKLHIPEGEEEFGKSFRDLCLCHISRIALNSVF